MSNYTAIVENIIESYPDLLKLKKNLKYSQSSGSNKDPTAEAAMAELPPEKQQHYDAIRFAILHTTKTYRDGARRILVIQASYWGRYSKDSDKFLRSVSWLDAQEYRTDFVEAVSQRLGLSDCEGCIYRRKILGADRPVLACMYCCDTGRTRSRDGPYCYSKCLRK